MKSFRKYFKQFIKDKALEYLESYSEEGYYDIYGEKVIKRTNYSYRTFHLKDERVLTKFKCRLDWNQVRKNFYSEDHHTFLVCDKQATDQEQRDEHDDNGEDLSQSEHDGSDKAPQEEQNEYVGANDQDFVGLSGLRSYCTRLVLYSDVELDEDPQFGLLFELFTSGKCTFSFTRVFDGLTKAIVSAARPRSARTSSVTAESSRDELLIQATKLVSWENIERLENRVINTLKEFLVMYRDWEEREELCLDEHGQYVPTKAALKAFAPKYW